MAGDFAEIVRPLLEQRLAAGEMLLGVIAATHQRTFSGELYGIGVTDRLEGLAGGEGQREGVGALAQWTKRHL